jgi:hypothetical protein
MLDIIKYIKKFIYKIMPKILLWAINLTKISDKIKNF